MAARQFASASSSVYIALGHALTSTTRSGAATCKMLCRESPHASPQVGSRVRTYLLQTRQYGGIPDYESYARQESRVQTVAYRTPPRRSVRLCPDKSAEPTYEAANFPSTLLGRPSGVLPAPTRAPSAADGGGGSVLTLAVPGAGGPLAEEQEP